MPENEIQKNHISLTHLHQSNSWFSGFKTYVTPNTYVFWILHTTSRTLLCFLFVSRSDRQLMFLKFSAHIVWNSRKYEIYWQIINNYWTRSSKLSRFVIPSSIIVFFIRSPKLFSYLFTCWQLREAICHWFLSRKRGSKYAADYYLQQNTFRWYYAWADHY